MCVCVCDIHVHDPPPPPRSSEGVDPLFESTLYDHRPCLELIGDPVGVIVSVVIDCESNMWCLLQASALVDMLNQETLSPR